MLHSPVAVRAESQAPTELDAGPAAEASEAQAPAELPAATRPAAPAAPWDNQPDPFATPPSVEPNPSASADQDSVRISARLVGSVGALEAARSRENPNKDMLRLPAQFAELAARPDIAVRYGNWTLLAKPRARVSWERSASHGSDVSSDAYLLEWYARYALVPSLLVSGGSESLQWGPSLLISPSNLFFLQNNRLNPLAEIPGSYFARAVWVPSSTWSASLIANVLRGERQETFREFERRYAAKLDFHGSFLEASALVGFGERSKLQAGGYVVCVPRDEILLYIDARFDLRDRTLRPVTSGGSFGLDMAEPSGHVHPPGNVLVGGSYTFASSLTLSVEYLFQSNGFDDNEAAQLHSLRTRVAGYLSGSMDQLAEDAARLAHEAYTPGLRFLRRHYSVAQARYVWGDSSSSISLWWISNWNDKSQLLVPSFDAAVSNHWSLLGWALLGGGSSDSEFRGLVAAEGQIGASYSF